MLEFLYYPTKLIFIRILNLIELKKTECKEKLNWMKAKYFKKRQRVFYRYEKLKLVKITMCNKLNLDTILNLVF